MERIKCPDCLGTSFRLGQYLNSDLFVLYIRCNSCGHTLNFFPVLPHLEAGDPSLMIFADTDAFPLA